MLADVGLADGCDGVVLGTMFSVVGRHTFGLRTHTRVYCLGLGFSVRVKANKRK